MLALVNQVRAQAGAPPVCYNAKLNTASQQQSDSGRYGEQPEHCGSLQVQGECRFRLIIPSLHNFPSNTRVPHLPEHGQATPGTTSTQLATSGTLWVRIFLGSVGSVMRA